MEALEIAGFAIRCAILPAAVDDPDPFEGEGAQGLMVAIAFVQLLLVVGSCPRAKADRLACKFVKALAKELWASPPPMHRLAPATAPGHRRNTHILLELGGA